MPPYSNNQEGVMFSSGTTIHVAPKLPQIEVRTTPNLRKYLLSM